MNDESSMRWIRVPMPTGETSSQYQFFAPVAKDSADDLFGFFQSEPGWRLNPSEVRFSDGQLIRFLILLIGSDALKHFHPAYWIPARLLKGKLTQEGIAAKQMRQEVRAHCASKAEFPASQREILIDESHRLLINEVELSRDSERKWSFSTREMSLATMAQFARVVLRDEFVKQRVRKYHFAFLTGVEVFKMGDLFAALTNDVRDGSTTLDLNVLIPSLLDEFYRLAQDEEWARHADVALLSDMHDLCRREWTENTTPLYFRGARSNEVGIRLHKVLVTLRRCFAVRGEGALGVDTSAFSDQLELALSCFEGEAQDWPSIELHLEELDATLPCSSERGDEGKGVLQLRERVETLESDIRETIERLTGLQAELASVKSALSELS